MADVVEQTRTMLEQVDLQVKQEGTCSSCSKGAGMTIPIKGNVFPAHQEFLSNSITKELLGEAAEDSEKEAEIRQCFSEAYEKECDYLDSLNVDLNKDRKHQILADILVWAEITQQHYDSSTRSFVLEPNRHDESFQRVGRYFKEAMQRHGLVV